MRAPLLILGHTQSFQGWAPLGLAELSNLSPHTWDLGLAGLSRFSHQVPWALAGLSYLSLSCTLGADGTQILSAPQVPHGMAGLSPSAPQVP